MSHMLELWRTLGNLPGVFWVNHKILLVDWNYLWGAVDCIVTEPIGGLFHVFPSACEEHTGLVSVFGWLDPCKAGRHWESQRSAIHLSMSELLSMTTPLVCSKYYMCVVFCEGFDGFPFLFGDVRMGCPP